MASLATSNSSSSSGTGIGTVAGGLGLGVSGPRKMSATHFSVFASPLQAAPADHSAKNANGQTLYQTLIDEFKLINDDYKLWKKNSPFLYDFLMSYAIDGPSLSCQWFPDRVIPPGKDYGVHRILTAGSVTEHQGYYLVIAEIALPLQDGSDEAAANQSSSSSSSSSSSALSSSSSSSSTSSSDDPHSLGGVNGKLEIVQMIPHDSEVNRCRYMPQHPNIIASISACTDILLYDCAKYAAKPPRGASTSPELRLVGHQKEGFGLQWSSLKSGYLASCGDDHRCIIWDMNINSYSSSLTNLNKGTKVQPLASYHGHSNIVEDITWHPTNENVFASVGDDAKLIVWDLRSPPTSGPSIRHGGAVHVVDAHENEANCISINPQIPHLFATGGSDSSIALWDFRQLSTKLHSFEYHRDQIIQLSWSPHFPTVLAACSGDRRVSVWDISRIGEEQDPEEAEDGPPELVFIHGGHVDKVADISWNPHEPWTLMSTSDDCALQIWQVAETIWNPPPPEQQDSAVGDDMIE